ncbi:LacI family DNA-binding transcriptional regulator [Streptantibioticus parmotrematis]|uniref:LacI family DNA-binding transcriptional regulator n=1 Tax=Streptantibioticus parmotrematis TaxID=2873249 RepID=UPI0033CA24C3
MATMHEVARRAGVSVTTVSHVVNSTRPVSDQARAAVEAAIRETGYVPNAVARSLATASTRSIGLAVSALTNPYLGELASAIESTAAAAGYTVLLADTHDDAEQEERVLRALRNRRVDGILLATSMDATRLRACLAGTPQPAPPVVFIDRLACPGFDQIGVENERATAGLVAHLVERGHRRIGMVAGREGITTSTERLAGYRRGLTEHGIAHDTALEVYGASDAEPARAAVLRLLDLSSPPTALISGNNHMTVGVLRGLRDRGVSVPDDMAVAAFDDVEWGDLLPSPLTAVAQPWQRLGREATRMLLDRLNGDTTPPRSVRLTPTLVHRRSCGCAEA